MTTKLVTGKVAAYFIGTIAALIPKSNAQPASYLLAPAPSSYSLTSDGLTAECWFRVRTLPGVNPRLFHAEQPGEDSWDLYVCSHSCSEGLITFNIYRDRVENSARTTTLIDDGEWHQVAATYDGVAQHIYLDGNLEGANAIQGLTIAIDDGRFLVGNQGLPGLFPDQFDGQIDEVRIWRVARQQSEIQADMNHEIPFSPGLVAYWRFDGDAVDFVAGNTLTPQGNVTICDCGGRLGGAVDIWNPAPCPAQPCSAGGCYANDFEGTVGLEWSNGILDTAPSGERFLGRLGSDTASLSLSGLASHESLSVSFDLYLVGSWDGNAPDCGCGPDVWTLSADQPLIQTTFSNWNLVERRQAYPDAYPGGDHPAFTGAAAVNALGYGQDSTYHLVVTFPHTADSLVLSFSASNLQALSDESWGIDNVVVTGCGSSCAAGNVNAGTGTTTDVLFINGSAGDPSRSVTVATGSPLTATLTASPSGPPAARYLLWIWGAPPTRQVNLDLGSSALGCVVNPTPFQPFLTPQPLRAVSGAMPLVFSAGIPLIPSPSRAPWTLTRPGGFQQPRTFTLQGVIEDVGSTSSDGFSVTNAVEVVIP